MKLSLTVVLFLAFTFCFSQVDNRIFDTYKPVIASDSNKIWLTIENQNFLHNNEYFNNLYDGITYLGTNLSPALLYQPSANLRLQAGWYFLKYSGRDVFSRSVPWFRCQYRITKNIDFLMGNIHGTVQHKLIEPLYSFDRHFSSDPETGIQILINSRLLDYDLWLNWEKFILPGDPFKEEFTMAGTGKIKLFKPEKRLQISVPLQWLAAHKGGQMETSSEPLQTYFNTAIGLKLEYRLLGKTKKLIGTENYLASYNDASSTHIKYYSEGYGIVSNVYFGIGNFDISAGYWYGEHFVAPRGEPLFQSVSQKYSMWWEPNKQLLLNKFQFYHPVKKGIDIAIRFESYYDLLLKNLDYSYSIFLLINQEFFLKKIN